VNNIVLTSWDLQKQNLIKKNILLWNKLNEQNVRIIKNGIVILIVNINLLNLGGTDVNQNKQQLLFSFFFPLWE